MKKRIERLVIVGHGYIPYLSAIYIYNKLNALSPKITVVDLGASHGDPLIRSLASMRHFHAELGIAEVDFVKKTKAEINLGFDYFGFSANGGLIFSDAQYGFDLNNFRFNYLFQKLKNSHADEKIEDYCLSAKLARMGHFTPPSPNPKSVYSAINYGYRLTNDAYKYYLKTQVEAKSIQVNIAPVKSVLCDKRGFIDKIYLGDGSDISGDLFIDASESGVLRDQLSPTNSGQNEEPVITKSSESNFNVLYSIEASEGGTSVSNITSTGSTLNIEGDYQGKSYRTSMRPNLAVNSTARRGSAVLTKSWDKNCISIGRALSDRISLLIDNSHLYQNTLARLIELWPRSETLEVEAGRFNAKILQDYCQVKDIDDLHIALAFNKKNILSTEATYKLALFREAGKIAYYENELLQEQQWPVLFYALGVVPSRSDISVAGCNQSWLEQELLKIKTTLDKAASAAPRYQDFIHSVHR